jgi:hypothetical protein
MIIHRIAKPAWAPKAVVAISSAEPTIGGAQGQAVPEVAEARASALGGSLMPPGVR